MDSACPCHATSSAIRNLYEDIDVFRWAAHGIASRDAPAQRSRAAQSQDDQWLFRAVQKSADACFDLRECCNEDAAVQVDASASTATCSGRYIGVTCFRKLAGRKRGPAWYGGSAAYFSRQAYSRLRPPFSVVARIVSNAPPHIACACCSQLSEPAGH